MNLVLSFDAAGEGRCFYSELIDLSTIGELQVIRASQVEFNNSAQRWEVRNLLGRLLFFSRSRAVCLAWEHNRFNR